MEFFLGHLSRIFSKNAHANTPEEFLRLTQTCNDQVRKMTSVSNYIPFSTTPKANSELCNYLAAKLNDASKNAHSFVALPANGKVLSLEEPAESLRDVFKLLYSLANVVEKFIRSCCQDTWIQVAVLMPNVCQHVLSIGFDLELLTRFFSGSLTPSTTLDLYGAEVRIVNNIASNDREKLVQGARALLRERAKTSNEYQLATHLLGRLETQEQEQTGSNSSKTYRANIAQSLKDLDVQLGRGSFGIVYLAMWLGFRVAKKTFYTSMAEFEKEVSILGDLSHPHITSLLCYGGNEHECYMVMELMDGDLFHTMKKIKLEDKTLKYPFNILEAIDLMLQVGGAMEYLHGLKIVHRDLKSMNILVKLVKAGESKSKTKYILAKLSDFGLSRTRERTMTYNNQTLNMGTPRWMAPELLISSERQRSSDATVVKYPFSSDVHSFAMVCYEILTGEIPYFEEQNLHEVRNKVLRGDRPELPSHCPPILKHLIERCWSPKASERPRFSAICAELRYLKGHHLLKFNPQVSSGDSSSNPDRPKRSETQEIESLLFQGYNQMEEASDTINFLDEIGEDYKSGDTAGSLSEAKIVVGLDFGTTFSGYAFAHRLNPEVYTFTNWPRQMALYPKTLTAIYYEVPEDIGPTAEVKSWGFPAFYDFKKDSNHVQKLRATSQVVDLPKVGMYLTRFKLHLMSDDVGESSAATLPGGFTVTQVIANYLREIGASIMRHLQIKFSNDITMADVQWCVTVPSIWDDRAKKRMEVCMAEAGLIRSSNSPDGSPYSLNIALEPEAASCYCHSSMRPDLKFGDRFLVADIGGGTTDIVVQEWMSETSDDFKVKEITYSTGGLCGGTYVDEQFNKFLSAKFQFLPQFLPESYVGDMRDIYNRMQWEQIKCSFGNGFDEKFQIELPRKLAVEWKKFDKLHGNPPRSMYDELELTHADIKAIFDPVVEEILALIADQLSRTDNVKVIFVVGGFGGSSYLLTKIKERFLGTVEKVLSPVDPGSAVCKGAVLLARNPAGITLRIARKTFGLEVSRAFKAGDPEAAACVSWVGADKKCDVNFFVYVKKGDPLGVDHCVSKDFTPLHPEAKAIKLSVYSSDEMDPKYTRGPGVDSKEVARFTIDLSTSSHMEARPTVHVSMYFGRSTIEVKCRIKTEGGDITRVKVHRDLDAEPGSALSFR